MIEWRPDPVVQHDLAVQLEICTVHAVHRELPGLPQSDAPHTAASDWCTPQSLAMSACYRWRFQLEVRVQRHVFTLCD